MASRIVVIEDDASIRARLEDTLRAEGYQVSCACRRDEGLALARRVKPDLVLLDLTLPDGEGFEVCRRLRDPEAGLPEVGILILTGRGHEDERIRGFELGADDYVTKPLSKAELLTRVGDVLRRTEAGPR